MKLVVCLAAALMLALPAAAQDVVFHPDPIIDCLDDAVTPAMQQACIGVAANMCMIETPGGGSTVGMGGCLDAERNWWDVRLNDVYQQLLTQHDDPAAIDNLRNMQRAWIPYRDARCDYEYVQWGGGTGGGPAILACLMQSTAEQTLIMEQNLR